jgi:hypothetical protein
MATRDQKLQKAKEKLNSFSKQRQGYSLQQTLSNTTVNGQYLQGLGLCSYKSTDDGVSFRSLNSVGNSKMDGVIQDFDKLNIHSPRYS